VLWPPVHVLLPPDTLQGILRGTAERLGEDIEQEGGHMVYNKNLAAGGIETEGSTVDCR